jgi:hypothetical protein
LTGKKRILKYSSLSFVALSKPSKLFRSIAVVCLFLTLSLLPRSTLWTELASAVGEFAQTVSDLAASDLGKSVSHSLEALAELERKAQETESAQARADQATLLSTADEYARLVNSVRVSVMNPIYSMPLTLTRHRWRLVHVCEYTTHGRMPMQISVASSRRTSAIVLKARPRLKKAIVTDIRILKSARCVFLPSMLAAAVQGQGTVPL